MHKKIIIVLSSLIGVGLLLALYIYIGMTAARVETIPVETGTDVAVPDQRALLEQAPVMSDAEYDDMLQRLQAIE